MPAMVKLFKMRRMTVWIACFAILLNALAPSLSYAMYATSSDTASILMEVCTANGMEMVDVAPATDGGHKNPASASPHCPFCLSHSGALFLPPAAATCFALPGKLALVPALFYQSPQPLFSWGVAHPRGPPATA